MKKKKDGSVSIRWDSIEREQLEKEAKEMGLKLSTYVKFLIRSHPRRPGVKV